MNKKLVILTLPLILSVASHDADAALRVTNASRNYGITYEEYLQQQANNPTPAQQPTPEESLPVRVTDSTMAEQIARTGQSGSVALSDLDRCSMIYPSGNFSWDRPTLGNRVGGSATCVATVELRQYVDGINDPVLARANLASGDAIECNIGNFPESTYTYNAYEVTFPADREPTMDDVKRVMNDEQKKNAGFKIAAGTLIGGIAGNAAGKNEPGTSGTFGGGKSKTTGSVVGALTGAALMTGNSYAGKVGGDIILSTGINAAAGGVIGNIVATGEDVLRIEDCIVNGSSTKCLWGIVEKSQPLRTDANGTPTEAAFYNIDAGTTRICDIVNGKYTNCTEQRVNAMTFKHYDSIESGVVDQNFLKLKNDVDEHHKFDDKNREMIPNISNDPSGRWVMATSAGRPTQRVAAMIPDFRDKTFGVKMADWYKWRADGFNRASAQIVGRDNRGTATELPKSEGESWTVQDFYPLTVGADDGGIIDITNKARLKGTMIGAGTGGALGAFTAYQGANDEIDARWASAVTEYKDSLTKFYCATGTRFLSSYNEMTFIPNMQ
ncbi:hypothetical protein LJC18_03935 [Lachnospiraceae bacterium OttesenSCG-928-E19]|nr:hypothetical protein [Lachnospiraceae bacterium OttesenSCG-928-E19]